MKKLLLLAVVLALSSAATLAQYPRLTVRQLQEVPFDSLRIADTLTNFGANSVQPRWKLQTSRRMGDTVTVTAVCLIPAKVITYTAGGWTMVLYDTALANQ